ncbi:GNAT family N-acetyltransferase [Devosia sp.]|uniref:GNAT family N-acetyltransferase n=1 Tax=Devosia sp. TaxID=1871048 RepID=UPI003A903F7C
MPTLTTQRLRLRPMAAADFDAYRDMMASERARFMGGPFDTRAAWGLFCHDVACWQLFEHGCLLIELAATGETVGQVGISHGPLFAEKELGWFLYAGFEGHGYATEAAREMRSWAFEQRGLTTLVSYCDAENAASRTVCERLGGVIDPDATRQDLEDVVYRYRA